MKRAKDRLHRVIVIGATPSGIAATNKLGELGIPVTLVDSDANIDKKLSNDEWRLKSGISLNYGHRPGIIRIMRNPRIRCLLPAEVKTIKHNHQGFRINLTRQQTFVDPERCILCGRCAEACPVSTDDGKKAIKFEGRLSLPGRPVIDKRRTPLCREGCPLGVNAQGYVALTRQEKFDQALELIREQNILPGICGRICNHPCENDCRRGQLDDAVSIRAIKRFLADYEADHTKQIIPPKPLEERDEKFAVIGSGPSGLAAAAELARFGCQVTVFEKEEKPGGLLRYGIGPHRLPRNILDKELEYIEKMGVQFICSQSVDFSKLARLKKEFDGIIISSGSWKDRMLGVDGENLKNVEGCLSFLSRFYRDEITELKESVAVVGDGNAAFDLARTLSRIGADVTLVSWFKREKIPADPEEIKGAIEEGVKILDKTQAVEFLGEKNIFNRLKCSRTRPGLPNENGIAWPVIVEDSKPFELAFDRVFVAIGQMGSLPPNQKIGDLKITPYGFIAVDDKFHTTLEKVYASGDSVTGPSTVVCSMAGGRAVAHQALKEICQIEIPENMTQRPIDKDFPQISSDIPRQSRAAMPERQAGGRQNNFAEVALGLSQNQVIYEASRCLQCGVCSECMECAHVCEAIGAIRHNEVQEEIIEQGGALIIADPKMAPIIKGDDVIRAYGPKSSKPDVYAMITRGFSAAAQALVLLNRTAHIQKGNGVSFYQPDPGLSPDVRVGVFVCKCDNSLGWHNDMDTYVQSLAEKKDVVHAQTISSACVPEGISTILKTVREKGITRMVLGSCVCCPLDFVCSACTDQRSRLKAGLFTATGLSRSMVVTRNIRGEALSLLKKDPKAAQNKFEGILDRSVNNARNLKEFPSPARIYNFATAIIGQSEAAVSAALNLAESGIEVFLFGSPDNPLKIFTEHPNVHVFKGSVVTKFSGALGEFQLEVKTNEFVQNIQVGAVILGEKTKKKILYSHQEGLQCKDVSESMQSSGVTGIPFFYPGMTSISGLFLAEPPGINVSKRKKGAAAAVLAAAVMPRGPRRSKGFTVSVNQEVCRGCGRCAEVCPYQAITLQKNHIGGWCASVDEAFCKGCGNCISVCPSNAADSPYRSQEFFEQILEEMLLQ